MTQYAVFLRGINVGGHNLVKMAELKDCLEKKGYKKVKTFLASGNVLLEAEETSPEKLETFLEAILEKQFGFPISVLVRRVEELRRLKDLHVFKDIPVTKETRLYVTFLSEGAKGKLKIPYKDPDCDFRILTLAEGALFSVLVVSGERGTVDAMGIIEKEFGKRVTTRNWNTVEKMLAV